MLNYAQGLFFIYLDDHVIFIPLCQCSILHWILYLRKILAFQE
jgi:hypothetical protein